MDDGTDIITELQASLKIALSITLAFTGVILIVVILYHAGRLLGRPIIHLSAGRPRVRTAETDQSDDSASLVLTGGLCYVTGSAEIAYAIFNPVDPTLRAFAVGFVRAAFEAFMMLVILGSAARLMPVKVRAEKAEESKKK